MNGRSDPIPRPAFAFGDAGKNTGMRGIVYINILFQAETKLVFLNFDFEH